MPPKKSTAAGPATKRKSAGAASKATNPRSKAPTSKAPTKRSSTGQSKTQTKNSSKGKAREVVEIEDDDDDEMELNAGEDDLGEEVQDDDDIDEDDEEDDDDDGQVAKIPSELVTRILHEFFTAKDEEGNTRTRITRDANSAVEKYVDVFVREAIARAAMEKGGGGFLEVSLFFLFPSLFCQVRFPNFTFFLSFLLCVCVFCFFPCVDWEFCYFGVCVFGWLSLLVVRRGGIVGAITTRYAN